MKVAIVLPEIETPRSEQSKSFNNLPPMEKLARYNEMAAEMSHDSFPNEIIHLYQIGANAFSIFLGQKSAEDKGILVARYKFGASV
jgi:hypothetical protein